MSRKPMTHNPDNLRNISVFRTLCTICGTINVGSCEEEIESNEIDCAGCGMIIEVRNLNRWS